MNGSKAEESGDREDRDPLAFPSREVDYRAHPERYRIGRGERGVFHCQPYKGELLPLWRFKTAEIARESSEAIYAKFLEYVSEDDFPGADLARKYLQMGFTRSRRYANHQGGRKYDPETGEELPRTSDPDPEKVAAAEIFKSRLEEAKANPDYRRLREEHKALVAAQEG